jgi:hypothetical protein
MKKDYKGLTGLEYATLTIESEIPVIWIIDGHEFSDTKEYTAKTIYRIQNAIVQKVVRANNIDYVYLEEFKNLEEDKDEDEEDEEFEDLTKIYVVEIGYELPKDHEEFEYYYVKEFDRALYDSLRYYFLDEQKAKDLINEYIKNNKEYGIESAYGFYWVEEEMTNLMQRKEIEEDNYSEWFDFVYNSYKDVKLFMGGIDKNET